MAGRFFSFTIAKNSFILDGTHQQGLREKHDFIFFSDRKLQIRGGKNCGTVRRRGSLNRKCGRAGSSFGKRNARHSHAGELAGASCSCPGVPAQNERGEKRRAVQFYRHDIRNEGFGTESGIQDDGAVWISVCPSSSISATCRPILSRTRRTNGSGSTARTIGPKLSTRMTSSVSSDASYVTVSRYVPPDVFAHDFSK